MASPKSGKRKSVASRLTDRAKDAVKKKANSMAKTYKKKRLIKKANKTATDL